MSLQEGSSPVSLQDPLPEPSPFPDLANCTLTTIVPHPPKRLKIKISGSPPPPDNSFPDRLLGTQNIFLGEFCESAQISTAEETGKHNDGEGIHAASR
jgi:hypothetical protein